MRNPRKAVAPPVKVSKRKSRIAGRYQKALLVACAVGSSGACSDKTEPTAIVPIAAGNVNVGETVPARGADYRGKPRWADKSDAVLWNAAAATDTTFMVGLRAPGAPRGIYKGRRLVSPESFRGSISALGARSGVTIVREDAVLPAVRLKISDVGTLITIRALPFVDYVEPAHARISYFDSGSGCDAARYTGPISQVAGWGDVISNVLTRHEVDLAWYYSNGSGQTVGITDTGVDTAATSEFSPTYVSSGASSPRTFATAYVGTLFGPQVICDHGTNMAGIIAAPLNGRSVVGAAYRANFVSAKQNDDVWPDSELASEAIDDVVNLGAKVILMAWGLENSHDNIQDRIEYYAPAYDVLFVGAAGTSHPWRRDVLFPAYLGEVLAVSAATDAGGRPESAHYGPQVKLISYIDGPTTGLGTTEIDKVGGASGASAVVAGVATLVRARHPDWNWTQVRDRMILTAGTACGMPGAWAPLVNALAAVDGLCVYTYGTMTPYYPWPSSEIHFDGWEPETSRNVGFNISTSGGTGTPQVQWSNYETGNSATFTLPRGTYTYGVQVRITDPNGQSLLFTHLINVYDDCENPDISPVISGCQNH